MPRHPAHVAKKHDTAGKSYFSLGAPPHHLRQFVVRHTSLWHGLGFIGRWFSTKDKDLTEEGETPENKAKWQAIFEAKSKPLPVEKEYDYFISYRWLTGRVTLFTR